MYHTHGSFFTNYICSEFFKFFEKFHFVQCNINIFENNHLINENFKITTILLFLANIERVWIFNQFFKISAYFILRQIAFVSWTYWTVQSDGQQNGHGQIINNMIKATIYILSMKNISNLLENIKIKIIHDDVYIFGYFRPYKDNTLKMVCLAVYVFKI